jgi:glycosyltransferase involved in cell wall biosynthesis
VAPDAPDPDLARPRPRPADLNEPYFLFVGTGQRKGLRTVLEAMRTQGGGPRLVVVGRRDRLNARERAAAEEVPVTFCGYVNDDHLAGLLQHAVALLFPSAYEGFGLPVIEAMAVGTPALVSDIPVMREVAGNAARPFPVGDARAWAAGMQSINDDPGLRADLVERGRARAAQFSWTTSARTILRTLERVSRSSS